MGGDQHVHAAHQLRGNDIVPVGQNASNDILQTFAAGQDIGWQQAVPRIGSGMLGIVAVAVLVLLLLFGLFRGRDRTVIRDTYVAPPVTGSRTVTTSTTTDDRMNLNSRAASGPGTNPGAGMNDPNARR